jgi:hypothetical protein
MSTLTNGDIASDRNATIAEIKRALQRRSGKPWSVTGGRGTAWGWIHIDAPPARKTWKCRERLDKVGDYSLPWSERYEEYDTHEAGHSTGPQDRVELANLLGIDLSQISGGVSVPAGSDYRQEYIDRANGRTPSKIGTPYWD